MTCHIGLHQGNRVIRHNLSRPAHRKLLGGINDGNLMVVLDGSDEGMDVGKEEYNIADTTPIFTVRCLITEVLPKHVFCVRHYA